MKALSNAKFLLYFSCSFRFVNFKAKRIQHFKMKLSSGWWWSLNFESFEVPKVLINLKQKVSPKAKNQAERSLFSFFCFLLNRSLIWDEKRLEISQTSVELLISWCSGWFRRTSAGTTSWRLPSWDGAGIRSCHACVFAGRRCNLLRKEVGFNKSCWKLIWVMVQVELFVLHRAACENGFASSVEQRLNCFKHRDWMSKAVPPKTSNYCARQWCRIEWCLPGRPRTT